MRPTSWYWWWTAPRHPPAVRAMVDESGVAAVMRVRVEVIEPAGGCWGQPARNRGVALARGAWLMFGQDDQCWLRGTLALVRARVAGTRCLHVFRVVPAAGFVVPQDEEQRLRLGFVDIDGVVVPRSVARRCRFGLSYAGDYDFIAAAAGALAAPPAWHGDVISVNQEWADRRGVTQLE